MTEIEKLMLLFSSLVSISILIGCLSYMIIDAISDLKKKYRNHLERKNNSSKDKK